MKNQQRLREGLKEGNKDIFEEIYKLYYAPLCFFCVRYVGDIEEAKEIVQGVFLKVWIKRKELKIKSSVKSYLYKAVQNYALNFIQQEKIKKKYIDNQEHFPKQNTVNGQQKLEEEELRKVIDNAILSLPDKRRRIFELSRFEDMKYTQIAEQLTISVKTVEAQMTKSLKYLRWVLRDYMPVVLMVFIWMNMS